MHVSADFFTRNRQKLIAVLPKNSLVIIAGNGRMQRNSDSAYPFRQDSNFYYLTGIEEPCATLIIDMRRKTSWVMLPLRIGVKAIFEGEIDTKALQEQSGVDEVITEKEGWQRLKEYSQPIFMPLAPKAQLDDMFTNPHRAKVHKKARSLFGKPIDIRQQFARIRSVKSPEELAAITTAAQITFGAISTIESALHSLTSEQAVEAQLDQYFKMHGASGHAFSPIVASGAASCMLHYEANNQPITGDVLLLDIGAEVSNYAADISRTLLLTDNQRVVSVHSAVATAQQEIITLLKPGISWRDIAEAADNEVGKQLIKLGLLRKGFTRNQVRPYFPHAIGHFLGLDTHDVGVYEEPLQENMVITVEPGIYLADEGFGVRIEDDVVITRNGAKILGI